MKESPESLNRLIRERAAELRVEYPDIGKSELEAKLVREFLPGVVPDSPAVGTDSGTGIIAPNPFLNGVRIAYFTARYLISRKKKDADEIKQSISDAVTDLFVIH